MTVRVRVYGMPTRIDELEGRQSFIKAMSEYLTNIDSRKLVVAGYIEGDVDPVHLRSDSGFVNSPITSGFRRI